MSTVQTTGGIASLGIDSCRTKGVVIGDAGDGVGVKGKGD